MSMDAGDRLEAQLMSMVEGTVTIPMAEDEKAVVVSFLRGDYMLGKWERDLLDRVARDLEQAEVV